jgi:AcrR family transcriptional regulator/transposase
MVPNNSQPNALVKGTKGTRAGETSSGGQTREQILLVASNLFAAQGYHGTTTREIAKAVGIRQPSLFHHFGSKAQIMGALLEEDLGRTVIDRERLARADEPAAIRLYRYIVREVIHIATSRYNVAGIYSEEVRTTPELQPWYSRRRRLHRAIDRIVRDGKAGGEFVDVNTDLVRASILGTLERAIAGYSAGKVAFNPAIAEEIASLLLRSVLSDPGRVPVIRETVNDSEPVSSILVDISEEMPSDRGTTLVSDNAWQVLSPALPPRHQTRGGQWKDDRQVFEAIAWRSVNSSSWRDLPPRLGPWQTAWKRYSRWHADGTWAQIIGLAEQDPGTRKELAWLFDS